MRPGEAAVKSLETLPPKDAALVRASGAFAPEFAFSLPALFNAAGLLRAEVDLTLLLDDWFAPVGEHHLQHAAPETAEAARAALHATDEHAQVYARAIDFYAARGGRWALVAPEDAWLAAELAQVGHLLAWAAAQDAAAWLELARGAATHLAPLPALHPQAWEWLAPLAQGLDHAPPFDHHALRGLGDAALGVNAPGLARAFYWAALARCPQDAHGAQAHILRGLGETAIAQDNAEAARDFFYKALVLYEVVGFRLGQARMQRQLGALAAFNQVPDYFNAALRLYDDLGHTAEAAATHAELAARYIASGDTNAAQRHLEEAYIGYGAVEFWAEQADILHTWGHMHLSAGQAAAAQEKFSAALSAHEALDDRLGMARALRGRGDAELQQGELPAAIDDFEAARWYYAALGQAQEAALMRVLLAHLYLDDNQRTPAAKQIADVLPLLERVPDPLQQGELRAQLRRLMERFGEAFETLWMQATGGDPLPDWLLRDDPDPDALPAHLQNALADADALLGAWPAALDDLPWLSAPARVAWLDAALALLDDQTSPAAHATRGDLLQERAACPGAPVRDLLLAALAAYDTALAGAADDPAWAVAVQNMRVRLLRDMAGMPGEDRRALLLQALADADAALARANPADYGPTQLARAHLLRELAGLRGENRAGWMHEALAAFDDVLATADDPLIIARAHLNRASLWQEIATLPDADVPAALQEALAAGVAAWRGAQSLPDVARRAEHMLDTLRESIIKRHGDATFGAWWAALGAGPFPVDVPS
ncbi:MAG: hypothetical protein ACLFTK_09580 [Anaerolineales bacterium]